MTAKRKEENRPLTDAGIRGLKPADKGKRYFEADTLVPKLHDVRRTTRTGLAVKRFGSSASTPPRPVVRPESSYESNLGDAPPRFVFRA